MPSHTNSHLPSIVKPGHPHSNPKFYSTPTRMQTLRRAPSDSESVSHSPHIFKINTDMHHRYASVTVCVNLTVTESDRKKKQVCPTYTVGKGDLGEIWETTVIFIFLQEGENTENSCHFACYEYVFNLFSLVLKGEGRWGHGSGGNYRHAYIVGHKAK